MLGYYNKEIILTESNSVQEELKKAIGFSGGTAQHYRIFENLLQYSIINIDNNQPFHDTRAAQSLLFFFPLKIQVFLSILLYNQEVKIYTDYSEEYNLVDNILLPGTVLSYSALLSKRYISQEVIQLLDDIDKDLIINDDNLSDITEFFSINKSINSLDTSLNIAIPALFNLMNFTAQYNTIFTQVAIDNDRVSAATSIAKYLNYKAKSISRITSIINQWQNQNSSI